jgi:aryl-alcohol dehydrogenase-like predicted oxidoreductase
MDDQTRRRFLCSTALGAAALGGTFPASPRGWGLAREVERRRLGKTDMDVSVLGFGGSEIGYARTEQRVVDRLLNSALDAGLNVIDTAECYVESETAIGRAVGDRRKDYWLFTKVGHWPQDGWSAEGIAASLERSLERLSTDHVDLVQLHSCGKDVLERGEAIQALEKARDAGKTRYIGYSGDRGDALHAIECGRFDTLQTSLNVFDQEAIDLLLPRARAKEMGVICKRPIGNAVWRHAKEPADAYVQDYWRRMRKLAYDFCEGERRDDPGPDGAAGTALRFTVSLPGVHTAIVGTTNPERFGQNARLVAAGPLAAETLASIRARWKEVADDSWVGRT